MRPVWRISSDGSPVGEVFNSRLTSLTLVDKAGYEADALTIGIDNQNDRIAAPRRGVVLAVELGFQETGLTNMGRFTVDQVGKTGPVRTIKIDAAAIDLRAGARTPKTREWKDVTLSDVAETIASENDLQARVEDGLGAIRYAHLSQTGESDIHFLTRTGEEIGAIVKVAERRLIITLRANGLTTSGQALPEITLTQSLFSTWSADEGDRRTYGSCRAFWQDRAGAKKAEVIAGDGEPVFEVRRPYADRDTAFRAAGARLARLNRSTRRFSGALAAANLSLRAEQPIQVIGLDDMSDGRWIATSVTHRLDGALTTSIEAEPAS